MAFKTVAFVVVRETAALLEDVGGVNLEGVGLILQTIVRVASGIATEVFKDGFSGVAQREVVAHADFKVLEEAYTGTHYADSASVLKGSDGKLVPDYGNGDGIHLNATGFNRVLSYLLTHAYLRQRLYQ